jgi:hypothetical protein
MFSPDTKIGFTPHLLHETGWSELACYMDHEFCRQNHFTYSMGAWPTASLLGINLICQFQASKYF